MLDHKFVWILGAGASYPSGIPLGSELVDNWLKELYLRVGTDKPLDVWATPDNLNIPGVTYQKRATFYPMVYQSRFRDHPDEGYAYLESVMSGKDPSPGYSILATTLAHTPSRHNAVVTTNFDNLVADAIGIYTDTFPFVCGHESLVGFVHAETRRPLICKIHRDLLLAPQNDPRGLKRLHDAWGGALRSLFQHYTPLVIGYGGNDDTLMDLMESLQPEDIKGRMIWCYYDEPSTRIKDLVAGQNGALVRVPDFDSLMVLLGEKMEIGFSG
jgi:protein O-mannosyl-transferase